MVANKSKRGKKNKMEFGPQLPEKPARKYLTTKGLIIRCIIFMVAVAGACALLWQEFSGR